ncbi:MAG: tetratricopeptide repeat protein [Cyanobacteria bacterium P01_D01_bin.1]
MTVEPGQFPNSDNSTDDSTAEDSTQFALNQLNNAEKKAQADAEMASGQLLFERGRYREAIAHFQTALSLSNPIGSRGGEIQLWLVNTYIASGREAEGLALCRKLIVHPDLDTKQQSKRILYILEAPELELKPEWVTKIPDLADMDDDKQIRYAQRPKKTRRRKPKPEPEPLDLSQVNTADNQFVWIALIGIILTIGGLFWLS